MKKQDTMAQVLIPTADPAWVLCTHGYDPLRQTSVESRFAISNGFLGIRGARSVTRGACWAVPPSTYVAGLFDTASAESAVPTLVPAADWLRLKILLPGGPMVHHPGHVSSHCTTLDMKRGALLSEWHRLKAAGQDDADAAFHMRTMRLVSLDERAIGLQLIQFEVKDGGMETTLEASFEGVDRGLVVERLEHELGLWRTHNSGKRLAIATASRLLIDGRELEPIARGELKSTWKWSCSSGQVGCFERLVAVVRADTLTGDPGKEATAKLAGARRLGALGLVARHEAAWASRWRLSDVEVEGDPAAQQALRFALYHLNSAANPADERVSIGARALTGEDYRGHAFWDTEIYLLPFYSLTWPEAARSLLIYRYRTLDGARAKAARMGWRGALYAWESADTGEETTPDHAVGSDGQIIPILSGREEQHISADVAYAVWQYWQASGDDGFLLEAGAEILFETARFWLSRATLEADGRSHIRGVIGPDEYHEHIDDNAFTNVLARWNILRALDVAALLRERWPARWAALSADLGLGDDELAEWARAAETMATGFDPETGLYEQFAGYNQLEEIDLASYAGRTVPMDVVLGRERTSASQVIKQADVVALLGLLPDAFPGDTGLKNFQYYEPRCSHGSSLSRAMHGYVAARLGLSDLALRYFRQSAAIDLGDMHVEADGGVHIAALGGIWMTAVLGFAGLALTEDGPGLDPRLPPGWTSLGFGFQWRGRSLRIRIGQAAQEIEASLEAGKPMVLQVGGRPHKLRAGKTVNIPMGRPAAARRGVSPRPEAAGEV
ncbi:MULTISPECIES: glycosyl hydrolase family 65 protein [Rhodomicrobium]|uniref:glycoside hydrolase family 65 protein n=1 Tax=Rhodomicrobium TaxID=1068 RepID=UPI000B4AD09A|nr:MULTISPECIES: glycosyl hydrolase family 65 protein [Rhodomicrobium]